MTLTESRARYRTKYLQYQRILATYRLNFYAAKTRPEFKRPAAQWNEQLTRILHELHVAKKLHLKNLKAARRDLSPRAPQGSRAV